MYEIPASLEVYNILILQERAPGPAAVVETGARSARRWGDLAASSSGPWVYERALEQRPASRSPFTVTVNVTAPVSMAAGAASVTVTVHRHRIPILKEHILILKEHILWYKKIIL